MRNIENKDFFEKVKDGVVLIDFYADWCGPCKMMAPIIDEIKKERDDVKVVKVDVEKYQELAQELNILSIPTLFYLKDGEIQKRQSGISSKSMINTILNSIS